MQFCNNFQSHKFYSLSNQICTSGGCTRFQNIAIIRQLRAQASLLSKEGDLYIFIPPSRVPEIRTLEIVNDGQSFDQRRYKDRNAVLIKQDGIVLYFHNYKTKRFSGRDELALQVSHYLVVIT